MQYHIARKSGSTSNILIYLEKDLDDMGYYSTTDGEIYQEKSRCNFTYEIFGTTVKVFNSVDKSVLVELGGLQYTIEWGDGQSQSILIEETLFHTYSSAGEYAVSLKLSTPWTEVITKQLNVGGNSIITNSLGTLSIKIPYTDITFEQNFITLDDAVCQEYEPDDVLISGFTTSRLTELLKYGQNTATEGLDSEGNGVLIGGITDSYTAYTINKVFYSDFSDGLTYFHVNVGDNPLQLLCQLIVKEDVMMGVVQDIEVQSDLYVERGTVSVFESNLRLCDLGSVGEIDVYGNKYFTVKKIT
jgi:hypothetical protein